MGPRLEPSGLGSTLTPELFNRQVFSQSFSRDKNPRVELNFKLSEDEIEFRIFLLTLETGVGQTPAIHGGRITLNGQPLLQPEHFAEGLHYPNYLPHYTNDKPRSKITFSPAQLKAGLNTLAIDLGDMPGSALALRLNGIIPVEKIYNAVHAKIGHDISQKDLPYIKGLMSIKLIETLKIRIRTNASGQQEFYEESGMDMSLLNDWIREHTIDGIQRTHNDESYEDADSFEAAYEKKSNQERNNHNLWYRLFHVDESHDMWPLIEEMREFPFIEESYPIFLG